MSCPCGKSTAFGQNRVLTDPAPMFLSVQMFDVF